MTILYIGERNYSSWSLRPWLALLWSGLPFETRFISLDQPGYGAEGIAAIRSVSPSGKVPALETGGRVIWDSLAIAEWAAEMAPTARLWPENRLDRAEARSITAEMHSGFSALRHDLPMNIRRRVREQHWRAETRRDVERIEAIWRDCRRRFAASGPYLFGHRTIADAFFIPVATRMRSYSVALGPVAAAYRDILLGDPTFLEWESVALAEWRGQFGRAPIDSLYPGADIAHG